MSLQHQNKSLPKHLQHVRLQKEEDEEQWISGEELCTEGSSDEETKVRDFKKKLKGSAQSSASSLKSRICSSSASIKEKSDSNSDPSSSKHVEWRPKRDDDEFKLDSKNNFYDIKAEKLDMEMKWKSTLEELHYNKNLYKNCNLSETQLDTNKVFNDIQNNEYNFDEEAITPSEYITDNIVSLDKEIETFGTILEGCKKDRIVNEQDICFQINALNICKVTSKSTDKFHKICNFKRERSVKIKRRKSGSKPKLYSRANKFKTNRRSTKMDENPVTKLTNEQSSRLEDLLAESDDNKNEDNYFKHTTEQQENIAIINGKLKTLLEKSDDADLNGKTSPATSAGADEENREWKNCFHVKDEKLRKINNQLKVLQNLKSTENNKEQDNDTEENQQ